MSISRNSHTRRKGRTASCTRTLVQLSEKNKALTRKNNLGLRSFINRTLNEKRLGFLSPSLLHSKPHIKNDAFFYSWNKKIVSLQTDLRNKPKEILASRQGNISNSVTEAPEWAFEDFRIPHERELTNGTNPSDSFLQVSIFKFLPSVSYTMMILSRQTPVTIST